MVNALKNVDKDRSANMVMGMVACWVALVVTMVCNWLFEYLRLGDVTMAEVASQMFSWFMPVAFTFNMWNVVYAALIVWLVLESARAANDESLDRQQVALFLVSCALNVVGLASYHYGLAPIALVTTITLWLALCLLYTSLLKDDTRTRYNLAPFSLYFGWATMAVVFGTANLATRLLGASELLNQASTIALAVVVLAVACLSVRNSRDYVFPIAVIWGNIGVGVHLMGTDVAVATTVLVLTTIVAMALYIPGLLVASESFSNVRKSRVGDAG